MTRINTNIGSLVAQKTLGKSNADLQRSLTRLSTGLRINDGRDDPAGLIASETLRSDIGAVKAAIGNSERANQVIATADSALAQVSDLLNDIRGLVTEAANAGALSPEQLDANQLQVDSSLEALNRIAQTTSFQGRRLLDGSLDFITVSGGGFSTVTDLKIDQANLGATGQVAVNVNITAAATQAQITDGTAVNAFSNANATLVFAAEGRITTIATDTIDIRAPGALDGAAIDFVNDTNLNTTPTAVFDPTGAGTLTVTFDDGESPTAGEIVAAINSALDTSGNATSFTATTSAPLGAIVAGDAAAPAGTLDADQVLIQADVAGPNFNNLAISVVVDATLATTTAAAAYDAAANTLVISISDTATTTVLAAAVTTISGFTATGTPSTAGIPADDDLITATITDDLGATADTALTGGGVLLADLVFELSGADGGEVFNFQSGTDVDDIVAAINLVTDATGVAASNTTSTLQFDSSAYGTKAFVDVSVITEGTGGTFESGPQVSISLPR